MYIGSCSMKLYNTTAGPMYRMSRPQGIWSQSVCCIVLLSVADSCLSLSVVHLEMAQFSRTLHHDHKPLTDDISEYINMCPLPVLCSLAFLDPWPTKKTPSLLVCSLMLSTLSLSLSAVCPALNQIRTLYFRLLALISVIKGLWEHFCPLASLGCSWEEGFVESAWSPLLGGGEHSSHRWAYWSVYSHMSLLTGLVGVSRHTGAKRVVFCSVA